MKIHRILLTGLGFFLLIQSAQSQQGELIIRQGHRDVINQVIYSPDGKYIYTAGEDRLIKTWDVRTGIDFRTFHGHTAGVNCLEITDDGEFLLAGDRDGRIIRWSLDGSGEMKSISAHEGEVNTIRMLPDQSGFLSGGTDKLIRIFDLKSLESRGSIEGFTGEIVSMGISPDGKRLISGGFRSNDVELLLVDLENRTILDDALKHVKGAGAAKAYTAAILTPLALATSIGKGKMGKDMLDFYSFSYSNIEFTSDGKRALICQNLYLPMTAAKGEEEKSGGTTVSIAEFNEDLTEFKNVTKPKRWMNDYPATKAMFSEDQTKIIANVKSSIKIYDLNLADFPEELNEARGYEPPVLKEFTGDIAWLTSIALSPDYRTVASASEDGSIKLWDIESGRIIRDLKGYIKPVLACEVMPEGNQLLTGSQGELMTLWDLTTGQLIRTFDRSWNVSHIDVSADGKYLITTSPDTKFSKLWNVSSGNMIKTFIEKNDDVIWVKFDEDPRYIMAATAAGEVKLWSIEDNKIKKKLKDDYHDLEDKFSRGSFSCSISSNSVTLLEDGREVYSDNQKGEVTDAVFSNDGKSLITTNSEGEIIVYHTDDLSKVYSMAQIGSFDFITYTPDFYYTCSKGASAALAYRQGEDFLPFRQTELRFNRPDVVAERIGYADKRLITSYRAAWEKRINRLGFSPEQLSGDPELPEISVNLAELPLASSERTFSFKVRGSDRDQALKKLLVYINDVPVFGSGGLDISGSGKSTIERVLEVELSAGLNEIRTSLVNESGMESLPVSFEINYDAGVYQPELYLASTGVSEYAESRYNLTFADKDARDIKDLFEGSEAFSKVHSRLLVNQDATSDNLRNLRPFLEGAGIDDVVIIFLAGHGILDNSYNYYFGSHDLRYRADVEGAVSYDELAALLDGLNCRKKLLIMDTCHAGEYDQDDVKNSRENQGGSSRAVGESIRIKENGFGLKNTFELSKALFTDLNKGTGSTVISAAAGTEFAMEGTNSPNGLFTSCILEGIRTRRADLNSDREFTVSELRSYVADRVTYLSRGSQVPTSREENMQFDLRIY